MKLSAAIILKRGEAASLNSLVAQCTANFDEVIFLVTDDGNPVDGSPLLMQLEKMTTMATVKRVHPEYVVEAALTAATGDWVFLFWAGEELSDAQLLRGLVGRHPDAGFVLFTGDEIRGLRRTGLNNVRVISSSSAIHNLKKVDILEEAPFTPLLPLTVILPTWRLGGLDVTLGALAKQTFKDFEVVIVDALHQWRAEAIEVKLECDFEFPLWHVPVQNSIFPLSCHSRFRNTGIRYAEGKRLVFLSDYACPPPEFLAEHAELDEKTIGISRWIRTALEPRIVATKYDKFFKDTLSVWDVIEHARNGEYLWSTFKGTQDPLKDCIAHERLWNIKPPVHLEYPEAHEVLQTQEYMAHWKADSVDTALVRRVNGWDESFDGHGGLADVDFNLRLIWAGAKMKLHGPAVRILDAHEISVAPLRDTTRNNQQRLNDVRGRKAIRCVYGLTPGIINEG